MSYEYRLSLYVIFGVATAVYAVFSMPALTTGGNQASTGVSQATFDTAVRQELAYCQAQPNGVNCQCFANKSGIILTHNQPKVAGAIYADKQQLARGQAARDC